MKDKLLKIVKSGVLAPSADNQHIFRVELMESAIRLWPSDEFAATTTPLRLKLGLVSIGAVIENMRLQALALGLDCNTVWLYENRQVSPFAELKLQTAHQFVVDELAEAIPQRHTNRRMYRNSKLETDQVGKLNVAASSVEGVQLTWLQGAERSKALQLIWKAESERFLRRALHEDLFSSIRFDLPWNETADKFLPPGALSIEAPMRPMFKALRNWTLMHTLTKFGLHHVVGLRAGLIPCWQAPALGLISTTLDAEQGAVAAGSVLERVWLQATKLGIAMQPLAASCMLSLPQPFQEGASDDLRSTLISGWEDISPGKLPIMVFRAGHASEPTVRTTREPIERYFIDAQNRTIN